MAANHIENSLSDITKDPSFKLGLLRTTEKYDRPSLPEAREQLRVLEARRIGEKEGSQARRDIETQISDKRTEIAELSKVDVGGQPARRYSLFDDKAVIDYARYVNSGVWVDNVREDTPSGAPYHFLVNSSNRTNGVVTGDPSMRANPYASVDYNDGLSVLNLIKWSEEYPALQLRYQDFVYCKYLNVYPNNRLVVLRKFRNGVPDNLFDYFHNDGYAAYAQPISTMLTWVQPKDPFITMNFNEVWKTEKGNFFGKPEAKKLEGDSFINMSLFDLGDSALLFKLLDTLDSNGGNQLSSGDGVGIVLNEPSGNPNLIRNSALRLTGGEGLASGISFNLSFDFEWRIIDNVDPTIAMLDLIGNCFRMGTSVAAFRMDFALLKNNAIQKILNGEFEVNFETFFSSFGTVVTKVTQAILASAKAVASSLVKKFAKDGAVEGIRDIAGTAVTAAGKHIISAFRESIKNALYSETGLPGGIWHVTVGNPKNPIVSCGDLIIYSSRLELGNELGLGDFPTSFKYNIELKSARERGRNELERILNAGRGRVYVYPHAWNNSDNHVTPPGGYAN